ncbi:MAG: DUF2974 domain-containing protein [Lachnospiraceae bacterium]|nr:DUF2974 domain-containing protein [Lachnospiraceae bacterium]
MSILLDYIKWRGDLSFDKDPFNEADAMLLSEMAYFPWDCIPDEEFSREEPTLARMVPLLDWTKGTFTTRPYQTELAELAANSIRYSQILVMDPVNEIDHGNAMQFSAVTFLYSKKQIFVSFRGTDSTIAGWKENMALAYEEHVPAQLKAVRYLKNAAAKHKGMIITGGHSKGGNLATYSAVFSNELLKKRIREIYSFDGPGFNEVLAENDKFRSMMPKIHTFVPQDSIIGILLVHKEGYSVIHSYEKGGAKQHLMDSWEVGPHGLILEKSLSKTGELGLASLDQWISGLSFSEKKEFVTIVFGLAEKNKIRSVDELFDVRNLVSVMNAYRKLDKKDRSAITSTLSDLGSSIVDNLKERYVDPVSAVAGKLAENVTGFATLSINYLEYKKHN